MDTRQIGRAGEGYVCYYLTKLGYQIIERNWTCYAGEIDIIAKKDLLTFVEVKFVRSAYFCSPHELFTRKKQVHLQRTINKYLSINKLDTQNWRLDLICLTRSDKEIRLKHYKSVDLL